MDYGFQIPTGVELEVFRKCSCCLELLFRIIFIEVKPKSSPQICDIKDYNDSSIKLHLSPKFTSVLFIFLFNIPL